ncbi:hypothetical protein A3A49_02660 [Candidatus Curtissbacteria bacterium RIFCSPLOWO2_01_FULL_38_11b]|uniref:Hydrolase TatD n=1 Tax=Candidatus Curtissbacteria bacterium RIFCSPLOWO2_01_FULL_38_11b TaxID=1797725 RepID=A0A1F5H4B5_9BACT|nr:MAG: hypothetical protein A3A49_02660 [Candidatus Curtissbacteria bacterium RIFCSPLOWO2_01_FULL_38_11b]
MAGLRGASVDNLDDVLVRAREAGVRKIITVGTTLEESKKAIEIAENLSDKKLQIYASVGIHPKDGKGDVEKFGLLSCFETLKQIVGSSDKVVAIGECGLDYYLGSRGQGLGTSKKERWFQRELFDGQIKLAADVDLPLITHCRNAWGEIFGLIENLKFKTENLKGVFHSWTGNWEAAKKALDLGFYISFSGIVTFKNATDIVEVSKKAPMKRILIETDSPFLAPEPYRGGKNEPKNVRIIAQFLADLRGLPFDKIAEATTENANRLFKF